MARIFTTPESEATAKSWLHDVTLAAGIRQTNLRSDAVRFQQDFRAAAQAACDELINRNFDNIDSSIRKLAGYSFNVSLTSSRSTHYKPEQVAKCLVYMAELTQLYWDDTVRTPYEIDEFKKTLLGAAVYKYGRYISAIQDRKSRSSSSAGSAGGKASGGAPQNGYKQSGPQSGNVRDLQMPQKVLANTSLIYKIVGDNPQSKNTPNVFIKPLSAAGAEGSTNKIFISSGNGYTDCTCYFDDPNDANTFLNKVLASNRVPSNVTNLRVVKSKADPNGYFLAGTEFGTVAISAKTLNEALKESAEEVTESVSGWEKATANYTKEELDELHTWMRRD